MTDLSDTIIAKSDQLNADDLIGIEKTVTITKVGKSQSVDQPITINFEGDNGKPFKPCKSMRRVLVKVWGADGSKYIGRSMTLYRDDTVKYAGQEVGGIRISHMSDIDKPQTMVLTASSKSKKPFTVKPLQPQKQTIPEPKQEPVEQESSPLLEAGLQAANSGTEAYKKWISTLSDDDKTPLRAHHPKWQQIAKKADEALNDIPM